jgi:hypothetical protein
MMAVSYSSISDFLSFIVTGLSLWVSFLLYMVTALCSPMGGFLHSNRVIPMGILPPPYGDSSLLPHGWIPLSHILGGSYLLPHKCLSSTSSGSILLPYKWISLSSSPLPWQLPLYIGVFLYLPSTSL